MCTFETRFNSSHVSPVACSVHLYNVLGRVFALKGKQGKSHSAYMIKINCSLFLFPLILLTEYMKRLAIYKENMVKAKKIQDMDQGSAKYGETVFSDLSGCCFSFYILTISCE